MFRALAGIAFVVAAIFALLATVAGVDLMMGSDESAATQILRIVFFGGLAVALFVGGRAALDRAETQSSP